MNESEKQITKEDLAKHLTDKIESIGDLNNYAAHWQALIEHFQYSLSIYDKMTLEAKKITDDLAMSLASHIEKHHRGRRLPPVLYKLVLGKSSPNKNG